MVIEVFNHVSKSYAQSKFKKRSYKVRNRTVRIWVKQGFKVSNKILSTVVTLTLFKFHIKPFTGPMAVKGRSKRKIKNYYPA